MYAIRSYYVVPARGGSKRLPRKNLLPLAGKPLVQWSLEAALSAHLIDDVCLSSDSEEILDVGSMLNGLHLIRRPDELAIDSASSIDVVLNALTEMETVLDQRYTAVVLIQPTSPFVNSEDIVITSYSIHYTKLYDENPVPLHAPRFLGNEKRYLSECVDSTFVSFV